MVSTLKKPDCLRVFAYHVIGAAVTLAVLSPSAALALNGDANCDERIDEEDLAALTARVFAEGEDGACPALPNADANVDEMISAADFVALVRLVVLASTPTVTPTVTPSTTPDTRTPGMSPSPTPTGTPTPSATGGTPPTRTKTPTITRSPTRSPTATRTRSQSPSPSATRTPTQTRTATQTPTVTRTATITRTRTSTPTVTVTRTPTPTRTTTRTRTPTPTRTATLTRTPSSTPKPLPPGPQITYFGVAEAYNVVTQPSEFEDGVPVYRRPNGSGFGFIVVVEGRPGSSRRPLSEFGTERFPATGSTRSNLEILADRSLGENPTSVVCDKGPTIDDPDAPAGGVPGKDPLIFDDSQETTDTVNDWACRFSYHRTSDDACTLGKLRVPDFVSPVSTTQYCSLLGQAIKFQEGRTTLKVRLRDSGGNLGDEGTVIVEVP